MPNGDCQGVPKFSSSVLSLGTHIRNLATLPAPALTRLIAPDTPHATASDQVDMPESDASVRFQTDLQIKYAIERP